MTYQQLSNKHFNHKPNTSGRQVPSVETEMVSDECNLTLYGHHTTDDLNIFLAIHFINTTKEIVVDLRSGFRFMRGTQNDCQI